MFWNNKRTPRGSSAAAEKASPPATISATASTPSSATTSATNSAAAARASRRVPATVQIDVGAEATATTDLVDSALAVIDEAGAKNSPVLQKHGDELSEIRELIQKIRYQGDFQTPDVGRALVKFKAVAESLVQVVSADAGNFTARDLDKSMDEITNAAENVRKQLAGDIVTAKNNVIETGFQINAPIGKTFAEGRIISKALGNRAINANQVNSLVYGSAADVLGLIEAIKWTGGSKWTYEGRG
ncbi:hypothetical protein B0T25DRAFT_546120 [Lasiosphaeria hispida]|uniref:Uncharacterized protein n=1 Tax=Lasiosphaeria hispida TaxID=260671 RepID=A0AAJ0MBX9_9PEZI|nr:hypothetical protein B0T25DRAFT_546120 [Lasiosphaeria hispida]